MNKKNIRFIKSWSSKKIKLNSLTTNGTFRCQSCHNNVELQYKVKCAFCGKIICDECAYIDAETKQICCPECW